MKSENIEAVCLAAFQASFNIEQGFILLNLEYVGRPEEVGHVPAHHLRVAIPAEVAPLLISTLQRQLQALSSPPDQSAVKH